MTSKKILAAALSFGLLFAGTSAPVFAQTSEMTEEQKSEYNDARIRKSREYGELLKSLQSKYDADKFSYDEEEKKLQEKQNNLSKLEEEKIDKDKKLNLEKENGNSEEDISKLQAESEELAREIDQQKQEINLLENFLENKRTELHFLQRDIDRTERLESDYFNERKNNPFLLEKADARYKVRGYEVDRKITYDEQNNFVSRLNGANTKEDLDNILNEVEELVSQRHKENPPTQNEINQDESQNSEEIKESKENEEAKILNDAKNQAIQNLEENKEIPEEEKEEFRKQIDQAADKEQVDEILEEIKNFKAESKPSDEQPDAEDQAPQTPSEDTQAEEDEESKALNKAKQTAKDELEKNVNLSDEEKKDFKEKIDSAQDKESLEKIIQDIKKADEDKALSDPSPKEENKEKPTTEIPSIDPDEKPKENIPKDQQAPSTDDDLDKLPETKPLDTPKDKQEDTLLAKPEEKTNPIEKVLTKTTPKTPKSNPSYLYRILENTYPDFGTIRIVGPTGKDYITTIEILDEKPQAAKDTIVVKDTYKYIKKGIHKLADLEATRDKLQKSISHNKATVRAIELLEELTPKTVAKNREKINDLLKESKRLLKEANYALAEYNYLLSK